MFCFFNPFHNQDYHFLNLANNVNIQFEKQVTDMAELATDPPCIFFIMYFNGSLIISGWN